MSNELLDVVDLGGEPTGQRLEKSFIHENGLWHRDVHVWLSTGTHFLQQQRAWDKSIMPGAWDISVGGHVAAGESYLEAAQRETEEELGLAFAAERLKPIGKLAVAMEIQPGAWTHRVVGEHFLVTEPGLRVEDLHLQRSEVIGARLYPIAQLAADLASPATAHRHAPQPPEVWALGIAALQSKSQGG